MSLGTENDIETQETYVQHPSHRVEEPTMGVDLFLVFCLDDEDDLDRDEVERVVLLWEH